MIPTKRTKSVLHISVENEQKSTPLHFELVWWQEYLKCRSRTFFVDLIVLTLFKLISTTYVVHLFTEYMAKNINKDRILEHSEWYSEGTFYSLDL